MKPAGAASALASLAMRFQRVPELDSLRGLAALFLVFVHLPRWNASLYELYAVRRGNVMVEIFFVLSGSIIHRMYAERLHTTGDVARFLGLRLGRIYPLHLVFLLLFLAVEAARWASGFVGADGPAFGRNGPTAFVEQVLLVQAWGLFGSFDATFNVAAWSISTELAAYILFMACALAVPLRARAAVWCLIVAGGMLALLAHLQPFDKIFRCFTGFAAGCLLSATMRSGARVPAWVGPGGLVGLALYLGFKPVDREAGVYLLVFPLSMALVAGAAFADEACRFRRVLRWRPLVWLGDVSYSVYMSNLFVILVIDRVARSARLGLLPSSAQEAANPLLVALALSALSVGLTLGFSALLYRHVEVPAREWMRRRLGASTRAAPAATAQRV